MPDFFNTKSTTTNFSITKDAIGVLRLRWRPTTRLSIADRELVELSGALYGHLLKPCETLDVEGFIDRITAEGEGQHQHNLERALRACEAAGQHALLQVKQAPAAEQRNPAFHPAFAASLQG